MLHIVLLDDPLRQVSLEHGINITVCTIHYVLGSQLPPRMFISRSRGTNPIVSKVIPLLLLCGHSPLYTTLSYHLYFEQHGAGQAGTLAPSEQKLLFLVSFWYRKRHILLTGQLRQKRVARPIGAALCSQ